MKTQACALAAALCLAACQESKPPATDNAAAELQAQPPAQTGSTPPTAEVRPEVTRRFEMRGNANMPTAAEPTPSAAPPARAPSPGNPLEGQAEVEFMGHVTAKGLKAKQLLIYIAKTGCDVNAERAEHFGSTTIPFGETQNFFIEVFVPQGSTGYVCALALDDKRMAVAQGAHEKNPLKMEGHGEVIFDQLNLALRPLKAPRALPKGL